MQLRRNSLFKILPWLVVLGLALLIGQTSPHAYAQTSTYYVAVDGSDLNGDGSSGAPWGTITYALRQIPDGSTLLVRPGEYFGRIDLNCDFDQGVIVQSEVPYLARLRNDDRVIVSYSGCRGLTISDFDIAHSGPGAGALVIHLDGGGAGHTSQIALRNNILHDSYNNDILKINNAAHDITVEGNLFYNQQGSDEHIDINSVTDVIVQDNIFMNDFSGSGRSNLNDTSSFIVIKDSNGSDDVVLGSERITVRRNIFLNWEGSTGSNFVLIGEDGQPYYEGRTIVIENNLMLGNASNVMRAPFGVKGGQDVVFRNNTISGDLPSLAYTMRLNSEGSNPPNENIQFYNNIWADPSGTMGAENSDRPNDFSDTPIGETSSFTLRSNLYWNGGELIPADQNELINFTDDPDPQVSDPLLPLPVNIILPRWLPANGWFAGGSTTIREAFERLVTHYGTPGMTSPIIDAADASYSPAEDILGHLRTGGAAPDLGAVELQTSIPDLWWLYLPFIQ